ncbi:MAG: metallophosphoesterase [Eubacterium sp.]|nr:metallophosphoesterase [Eubacterium sp.]
MKLSKIFLTLSGIGALGLSVLFLESYRELRQFRIRKVERKLPGVKGRVLFLTDYHEAVGGKMNPKLLKAAEDACPDLILVGGDFVNGNEESENYQPALDLINGLTGIAPVVYAYGNHEKKMIYHSETDGFHWDDYRKGLDPEVTFLVNQWKDFRLKEGIIRVYGLDMEIPYFMKHGETLSTECMERYLGPADSPYPILLLAHDPSWGPVYGKWGADLTLSGHYHGGIIRLPLLGGIVSPKSDLFPHFDHGMYEEGDTRMLVSSGLGQHTIPVRFNNLPEMVLIEFV